jgi:hypothetical protein
MPPPLITSLDVPKAVLGIDNGHWKFPKQMGEGKASGFVYVIRDNFMERFYLGKKKYKTKIRGTQRYETGAWRTYISSSNTVKQMLAQRPIEEFEFIVLEEYIMAGALSYAETWSLCHVEAPTTDTWYNKRIEEVSWNVRERVTDRHKDRLHRIIAMEKFEE